MKQKLLNIWNRNKCIYCPDRIWNEDEKHFESACCGRGMCQACYDALIGTEEQWQIDYMEDEDYERYVAGTNIEDKGDYICYACCDNGNIYKLKK